ncbi:MAG: DUF4347 domain-containing protein, partial [Cyanobacteria bacterium J06559_3]
MLHSASDRVNLPVFSHFDTLSDTPVFTADSTTFAGPSDNRHRLVVIDAAVAEAEVLANSLTTADVIVLDPAAEGIAQITALLAEYEDLASLHIVSHGDAGQVTLGNTTLSAATLPQYVDPLTQWQQALSDEADILLYGCEVAKGAAGEAFVTELSQLTGADVVASDDLTGNAALGGNWQLEFATGTIESELAFDAEAQSMFRSTLDDPPPEVLVETDGVSTAEVITDYGFLAGDPDLVVDAPEPIGFAIDGQGRQKIEVNYTVTEQTVLEFDYRSDQIGSLQGLGFDTDNTGVRGDKRLFNLYSQSQNANDIVDYRYTTPGEWQTFQIPVGQHYTGFFNFLTFINDANSDGVAHSAYRNITLDGDHPQISLNNNGASLSGLLTGYGGLAGNPTVVVDDSGVGFALEGAGRRKLLVDYTVVEETVLAFEYKSDQIGSLQGLGFDDDDNGVRQDKRLFNLYSQYQNANDIVDYRYTKPGEWQTFQIPVGQHYTGVFDFLVFVNDATVDGAAHSAYRDITLYDEPLTLVLANDTGTSDSDGQTANPTLTGHWSENVASNLLQARIGSSGSFTDVSDVLQADGSFTLDRERLSDLNGGSLPYGDYAVEIRAQNPSGTVFEASVDLTYELQLIGAPYAESAYLPIAPEAIEDNGFQFTFDFSEFLEAMSDDEQFLLSVRDGDNWPATLLDNGPNGGPVLTVELDNVDYATDIVEVEGTEATIDFSELTSEELATAVLYTELRTFDASSPARRLVSEFGGYAGIGGGGGGGGVSFSLGSGAASDGGSGGEPDDPDDCYDDGSGGVVCDPDEPVADPAPELFLTKITGNGFTVEYDSFADDADYTQPQQIAFEDITVDLNYSASGEYLGSSDPELLDVALAAVGFESIDELKLDKAKSISSGLFQASDYWNRINNIVLKPNKDIDDLTQQEKTKVLDFQEDLLKATAATNKFTGHRQNADLLKEAVNLGNIYAEINPADNGLPGSEKSIDFFLDTLWQTKGDNSLSKSIDELNIFFEKSTDLAGLFRAGIESVEAIQALPSLSPDLTNEQEINNLLSNVVFVRHVFDSSELFVGQVPDNFPQVPRSLAPLEAAVRHQVNAAIRDNLLTLENPDLQDIVDTYFESTSINS